MTIVIDSLSVMFSVSDIDLSLYTFQGIYNVSILAQTIYTVGLSVAALLYNLISTKSLESTIKVGWIDMMAPVAMGVFHVYMLIDGGGHEKSIIAEMINGFNAIVGTIGSLTYMGLGFMGLLRGFDLLVAISYVWSSASSIYYMIAV